MSKSAEILREGARLIELDGWRQGGGMPAHGRRHCFLNAVSLASDNSPVAVLQAEDAMRRRVRGYPMDWNDAPGQTAANVIATMRSVADDLDVHEVDR